ncbi:response regulator [Chitinophaga silvatica]|uniref:Response regulator n=1 Tax=Chitinophaga silvatica TaxID=2282649 RepID=A0A3E1Y1V5_9BACT|nr:response regulator [Chitinophaga silvatica]
MKMKILHLEDDIMFSHIVRSHLEGKEMHVYSVMDGESAWSVYLQEKPDLCLLDIILPGISGIDLGERIRELDSQIPIFYLSGECFSQIQDEVFGRGGANGFFSKTRNINELSQWINQLVNNKSRGNAKYGNQDRRHDISRRQGGTCL